ncbi:MAG TPA: FxLYD domain-containing protein [Clostridia bacterium]|nr:FxLYD domain-containing protein [Clostridia bacterium]
MEERRCPKCAEPIAAEEKICHNCEFKMPQPPKINKSKRSVSTGVLWLAALMIIVGLVTVGTLTTFVVISSVGAQNWGAVFSVMHEPDSADMSVEVTESESLPLTELPSKTGNDYIILKKALMAQRSGDSIEFACMAENISNVACVGVGVEVELYNAEGNFVGSSSTWISRNIQPGEMVELNFGTFNGQNVRSYRLTKIGGEPIETPSTKKEKADASNAASEESLSEESQSKSDGDSTAQPRAEEAAPTLLDTDVSLSCGLTLVDDVVEKAQGEATCRLQGRIRNDSGIKYNSVYVKFVVYDADNNQIATTVTSTNDFEPGVIWEFSAPALVSSDEAAGYKISSVSAY